MYTGSTCRSDPAGTQLWQQLPPEERRIAAEVIDEHQQVVVGVHDRAAGRTLRGDSAS